MRAGLLSGVILALPFVVGPQEEFHTIPLGVRFLWATGKPTSCFPWHVSALSKCLINQILSPVAFSLLECKTAGLAQG